MSDDSSVDQGLQTIRVYTASGKDYGDLLNELKNKFGSRVESKFYPSETLDTFVSKYPESLPYLVVDYSKLLIYGEYSEELPPSVKYDIQITQWESGRCVCRTNANNNVGYYMTSYKVLEFEKYYKSSPLTGNMDLISIGFILLLLLILIMSIFKKGD